MAHPHLALRPAGNGLVSHNIGEVARIPRIHSWECQEMFPAKMLQVVGHTPVAQPVLEDNVLSTDTFSPQSRFDDLHNRNFVSIDSENCEWDIL